MREALIILPNADNNGGDLSAVHLALQGALCDTFGGATFAPVAGIWRDEKSGEIFADDSTEYRIAADWNPAQREALETLVSEFGRKAGQLAVYVRHANGSVQFVEPREAAPVAPRDYQPGELYRARQEAKRQRLERYGAARAAKVAQVA